MAVDTRNRRASCVNLALPFGRVYPNPDGSLATVYDWAQMALCYAGSPFFASSSTVHVAITALFRIAATQTVIVRKAATRTATFVTTVAKTLTFGEE